MKLKAIPDGYHSVTPYLSIKGAAEAIAFCRRSGRTEESQSCQGHGASIAHQAGKALYAIRVDYNVTFF